MEKRKWNSIQSITVIAIIFLIFLYIGLDIALTKPKMRSDINTLKTEYTVLSSFVHSKVHEIDSTLKKHNKQIIEQKTQIGVLQETFDSLKHN